MVIVLISSNMVTSGSSYRHGTTGVMVLIATNGDERRIMNMYRGVLSIYIYKATWKNYDFVWRLNGGYTFETGPSFSSLRMALGPGFLMSRLISPIWSV